jgi:ribosomal protein L37AE/L43A
MADDTNTAEREAAYDMVDRFLRNNLSSDEDYAEYSKALDLVLGASLAASAGSTEINGQLYTALNNLFTHLGMEGCITADHAFVWDAMTALKRIDGGVHLDNLAVPVDPDAHRDDMLAAVQLLEDGEWAEHFAKTPIGMRLEEQITKLHGEISANASGELIPDCPVCGDNAKVSSISGMWHCENCHGNRAASAGSEPVAPEGAWDNLKQMMMWSAFCGELQLDDALANIDEFAGLHPSPPEGMAGWKLVPVEPTPEMIEAGRDLFGDLVEDTESDYRRIWGCMAGAAPPIPASEAKEL